MIASVTDLADHLTGAHRTWLDPGGFSEATLGKAPIDTPRRAMGDLLGHAVLRDNLDENGATIWVRIGGRVLG